MTNKDEDLEKNIYELLLKMENGNIEEKKVAFECMGILGNESLSIDFNDRLILVKKLINKNNENNK